MKTHVLGFPRIGAGRALKKALETYWSGSSSLEELLNAAEALRQRHWRIQHEAGLSYVTTGDFSLYDHVLDTTCMLGIVPERFVDDGSPLDLYFHMARGDAARNIPAMEMTKWFNTNYHYIVPEFTPSLQLRPFPEIVTRDVRQAIKLGYHPKPVLLGPVTYLALARDYGGCSRWNRLQEIVDAYATVLAQLAPLCDWIQVDEPILCTELPPDVRQAFGSVYRELRYASRSARLLLTTYFGRLEDNLPIAVGSGCAGLHIDLVHGASQLDAVLNALPEETALSVGLVNGRNIWKTDTDAALNILRRIVSRIGADRLLIGSSCSLLHCPLDLEQETRLPREITSRMAFAVQKCREIAQLGDSVLHKDAQAAPEVSPLVPETCQQASGPGNLPVRARCDAVTPDMLVRKSPYAVRKALQQEVLRLPLFPTTTIGSYPQTPEIRKARKDFREGKISASDYEAFLKQEIRITISRQEELDLDVLVHGEAERVDMVEYFGQQLEGFCFTDHGWVQSYGSRCVKPPVIYGDVSRPRPMTVSWLRYAQSLTDKPVKGMLTGPVTMLCWSFVRDDLPRETVCRQIALALRDEVLDLEQAGLRILQIDEAALREGLPLRRQEADVYLRQAVEAFRLTVSGVRDTTQIHTHMCYSEFNTIIRRIAEMDADVISIESSRSNMALLEVFNHFHYPNAIGPGVYDIHSPRVPSTEEMLALLKQALRYLAPEQLWVNPDCGLKTRAWPETLATLQNMVNAATLLRREYASSM